MWCVCSVLGGHVCGSFLCTHIYHILTARTLIDNTRAYKIEDLHNEKNVISF